MGNLIDRDAAYDAIGFERCDRSCTDCPTKCTWFYTVKNIPAVNRWIPSSERLPEDFVWCLVCMSDGCIRLGKWNGEYDEQGVWWVSHPNSGGKLYRIKNVPHWMPMPDPPEKED